MIRATIELIPCGVEEKKRVIGLVEIANCGGDADTGNYIVMLKKSPPYEGALKNLWRKGVLSDGAAKQVDTGYIEGFQRLRRGPYDLLYRALKSVVGERNEQ